MNNFPSCFRRGPGGGKPANRCSPLGLTPESRARWTASEQGGVAYYRGYHIRWPTQAGVPERVPLR